MLLALQRIMPVAKPLHVGCSPVRYAIDAPAAVWMFHCKLCPRDSAKGSPTPSFGPRGERVP